MKIPEASIRPLPNRPSLENLRKRAKGLAKAQSIKLTEAQRRIAREYGHSSWASLAREVNTATLAKSHRRPSKKALLEGLQSFDLAAVDAILRAKPNLTECRDDKGRTWLHLLCRAPLAGRSPRNSIRVAETLIAHGLALDDPAKVEPGFRGTPLWHCIAFSRNLALAEHFLKLGAEPHGFYAAAYNDDVDAIDLLVRYGGDIEAGRKGDSPFIAAVGWDRLKAAEALARHGADLNAKDDKGRTALHMLLERGRDFKDVARLVALGCDPSIPGRDGRTAAEIMARKKDPRFRGLARVPQ